MSVRTIITIPNPLLRQVSKPVTLPKITGNWDKKTKTTVKDLLDTVKVQKDPPGVGLSAVQIGKLTRIFVAKIGSNFEIFINPEITWYSEKDLNQTTKEDNRLLEGCLSIPLLYGFVNRPIAIKLKWVDYTGQPREQLFEGKVAIFIQHEYDHVNGVLFVDRILAQQSKIYRVQRNEQGKEELVEVQIS
jgi:peptide deformylase